jgi:hypothetical protein
LRHNVLSLRLTRQIRDHVGTTGRAAAVSGVGSFPITVALRPAMSLQVPLVAVDEQNLRNFPAEQFHRQSFGMIESDIDLVEVRLLDFLGVLDASASQFSHVGAAKV